MYIFSPYLAILVSSTFSDLHAGGKISKASARKEDAISNQSDNDKTQCPIRSPKLRRQQFACREDMTDLKTVHNAKEREPKDSRSACRI
jgi:hypothetical protein